MGESAAMPGSTSTYAADTEHLNTRLQGFEKRSSKHAAGPGRDVGIERRTEGIGRNPSVQPSLYLRSPERRASLSGQAEPYASNPRIAGWRRIEGILLAIRRCKGRRVRERSFQNFRGLKAPTFARAFAIPA